MDARDMPIWYDCPWRSKIPKYLEIKIGVDDQGFDVLALWWPEKQKHVVIRMHGFSDDTNIWLPHMIENLNRSVSSVVVA